MQQPADERGSDCRGATEFLALLRLLDEEKLLLLAEAAAELAAFGDSDGLASFRRWRDDPQMETLMSLAARLDAEALEQLVFEAEERVIDTARAGHPGT
jgi:hypothetical protein